MCFSSMLAKGLSASTLLGAAPFASLTGLSGGGVASCGMALKLLLMVSFRFRRAKRGDVLFGQLLWQQQFAQLTEGVVQVLGGALAPDLVVQDAHGALRDVLLFRGQG